MPSSLFDEVIISSFLLLDLGSSIIFISFFISLLRTSHLDFFFFCFTPQEKLPPFIFIAYSPFSLYGPLLIKLDSISGCFKKSSILFNETVVSNVWLIILGNILTGPCNLENIDKPINIVLILKESL